MNLEYVHSLRWMEMEGKLSVERVTAALGTSHKDQSEMSGLDLREEGACGSRRPMAIEIFEGEIKP